MSTSDRSDRTTLTTRIALHADWLSSDGRQGERLVLADTDLGGLDLGGSDLRHADLHGCCLRQTLLQGCRLDYADLSGTRGLLPEQLAGADLTGARLPAELKLDSMMAPARALVINGRKLLLIILLAITYTWLTIATTGDVALLTDRATTPLPVILTELPTSGFYWAAPLILLGCYLYLHLHLQHLWDSCAGLPAVLPDGRALSDALPPWPLIQLIDAYRDHRRGRHPLLARLRNGIAILLAWWLIPLTLIALWLRYLPRHDGWGSGFQLICLGLATVGGLGFYRLAAITLGRTRQRLATPGLALAVIGSLILAPLLTYGVIATPPSGLPERFDPRGWAPRLLTRLGYSPHADFSGRDVSLRPALWNETNPMLDGVRGAELSGTNLHHLMGRKAFLVRADLSAAQLRRADLEQADLRQARLTGSDLHSASLLQADLREADLSGADLREAALLLARLQDARLDRADLRGAFLDRAALGDARLSNADLRGARLTGADLRGADLTLAILREADLSGADLRDSRGLQCHQLKAALIDATTRLPEEPACPPSDG